MGGICSRNEKEKKKPDVVIKAPTVILDDIKDVTDDDFFLAREANSNQDCPSQPNGEHSGYGLEYPLEISRRHSMTFDPQVRIDFSTQDYRAFCLLIHPKYGAVLLHCTRKKKKPPHYQLPGGHVDDFEFKQISRSLSNYVTQKQLYHAARLGCAREVYEETGIDFRERLDELLPMILYNAGQGELDDETLINEYKSRIFFVCELSDSDFPHPVSAVKLATSLTVLPLSRELN